MTGEPANPTPPAGVGRRVGAYLSDKSWISLPLTIGLVGAAWALGTRDTGINQTLLRRELAEDRIVEKLADMAKRVDDCVTRDELRNLFLLLKRGLPKELQDAVPEVPR